MLIFCLSLLTIRMPTSFLWLRLDYFLYGMKSLPISDASCACLIVRSIWSASSDSTFFCLQRWDEFLLSAIGWLFLFLSTRLFSFKVEGCWVCLAKFGLGFSVWGSKWWLPWLTTRFAWGFSYYFSLEATRDEEYEFYCVWAHNFFSMDC